MTAGALFQPNNLSLQEPVFGPLRDDATRREIDGVLQAYNPAWQPDAIAVFGGTNVVSRNYRVESSGRCLFLKSRDGETEARRLEGETRLGRSLRALGVAVPVVIPTAGGADVLTVGHRSWVAYEFEDGVYFQGRDGELASAAEAFGRLTLAAGGLDSGPAIVAPFAPGLEALLLSGAPEGDAQATRLVAALGPDAARTLSHVRGRTREVERLVAVTHTDIHPLNLLVRTDGSLCILDLEDVQPYPVLAALGFGAYQV